ncbi:MAG: type II secretion system F family protein [Gammaproteobacteria bacterium]|nr:type II secretion system F family protein [Gammaproteobacteria bacterium]
MLDYAVKLDDMIIFCRQAQTLLKAGIPLFDALCKIAQTTQSKRLKLTLIEITKNIAQGQTLSASLRRYPKVFSSIFCSIIDAGESGGKLDMAFSQLAGYINLELETKKRIKSATRYPIFVICFVISAMLIVNFLVIPSFQSMYENFDTQLPLPTQVIIATSKFLTGYWYIVVIALTVLFIATRRLTQTPRGGYIWDRMKLRVPVMGSRHSLT